MLDPRTFGGSRAAEVLVEILKTHDFKTIRKIGRFWSYYTETLSELTKLNSKVAIRISGVVYHKAITDTDVFSSDIKTFLRNIVSTKYKIFLNEMDGLTPYKKRVDNPNKKRGKTIGELLTKAIKINGLNVG